MKRQKTRMAIAAIVSWKGQGKVMLVKKSGIVGLAGEDSEDPVWTIPEASLRWHEDKEKALWRMLDRESGSTDFRLVDGLAFRVDIDMPEGSRWDKQETQVFFLEYDGRVRNFEPRAVGIDEVMWADADKVGQLVEYEVPVKLISESLRLGFIW